MAYGNSTTQGDAGGAVWPYSRDPRSPNRPPFLPQAPLIASTVPTPFGPAPIIRRAVPGDSVHHPISGLDIRQALNLYYGRNQGASGPMDSRAPAVRMPVAPPRSPARSNMPVRRGPYMYPLGATA